MTDPYSEDTHLLSVYRQVLARVEGIDGITGVDMGFIYENGERTDERGVRVYTPDAQTWRDLASRLPEAIEGVKISRMLATFRLHRAPMCKSLPTEPPRRKRFDPIQPGVSVANLTRSSGTLGLIVNHPAKGRCILSCAHVLVPSAGTGRTIVQPGGSISTNKIANAEPPVLDEDGDAAIGILNGSRRSNPAQLGTGVVVKTVRMPRLGEIVTKSGLGTGVTCGVVDGLGRYLPASGRNRSSAGAGQLKAAGMNGFRIVPRSAGSPGSDQISDSGDSGATWYAHADLAGVGLHVAGETDQNDPDEHAIACYLPRVLQRLGVTPALTST